MADLLETTENGITTPTPNPPERLNPLSPAMTSGLKEALERLSTDRECGAIVITGAGRGWCAGGDVKTVESRGKDQTVEDGVEGLRHAHQLPLLLRTIPKVVIASINGPVAGAGLGLALACDLRIAGKSARFGTAFARIGYSGDYGGSWGLTQLVGPAKAPQLYFTPDIIDSVAALVLGIVNRPLAGVDIRTVTEMDNVLFAALTMNPQPLHLDAEFARTTEFGRPLVNSIFTLGLVIGMTVGDSTLGTTVANLGMSDVRFPKPVFHGDTIHARSTVIATRRSKSRSDAGIVEFEHQGLNQRGETVAICRRAALMKVRPA